MYTPFAKIDLEIQDDKGRDNVADYLSHLESLESDLTEEINKVFSNEIFFRVGQRRDMQIM